MHFAASAGGSQVRAIAREFLNGCTPVQTPVQETVARL
ncbi:MAG: hypothetical protein OJF61_000973 [Rhodanobacteraceae bacterium]|nr:MAG: hypothetical protein OJF61_000973 [Rhodanobacteraceae bacterium]